MDIVFSAVCQCLLLAYGVTLCKLHGRGEWRYLLPAVVTTWLLVLLESLMLAFPVLAYKGMGAFLAIQVLLCPAWLLFSVSYARKGHFSQFGKLDKFFLVLSLLPLGFVVVLPVSSFYYQTDFSVEHALFLESSSFFFYLYLIVIQLLTIGNLESTLRNSRHSEQWRIKLALLGSGIIIISLVLFYSQGLLHKALDMDNALYRNIGICAGLLLMLYSEWCRESARVRISRKVAFRSLAVAVAGIYLLGLGIIREGTRLFGGDFTHGLFLFCVLLFVIAGFVLLLSHSFRRKISILVQRNLYDEKYDYKGQWMLFSERLSLATDNTSLIRAALLTFCETFGRIDAFFIPVDQENPARGGQRIFYVVDASVVNAVPMEEYATFFSLPAVPSPLGEKKLALCSPVLADCFRRLKISLFLPVRTADEPEGVLFLGAPMDENEKYDHEDFELMEAMGRQVGLCARSFRLSDELATSREIEALAKLGVFVLHDLKNQVYALSLLTSNAQRFIGEPDFQKDMLGTLANTVANMKILITQLTQLPSADTMRFERADLHELAVRYCGRVPGANVSVSGSHPYVTVDEEQIGKMFTNLCLNAVEAGGNKPIQVEIADEGMPLFRIHDEGGGIPDAVLQSGLFKPFNTTKQRGMGIGLYHSRKILEAHGAKIALDNRPGQGCTFTVMFEGEKAAVGMDG